MKQEQLPISLIAHTVFCPRRAWLEASGERVDSAQMELGHVAHIRVDDAARARAREHISVDIRHADLDLTGRCDVVQLDQTGALRVIDYKATPVRRKAEVTPAQEVQLTLQRLCLIDMGYEVRKAEVYFTNHEVHVDIPHSIELDERAINYVAKTRAIIENPEAPQPLEEDKRCRWCSHASICLPDETLRIRPARQISVSNPDGEVLHVTRYGARVQLRRGRIEVVKGDERLMSAPVERVIGVVVHGNVDLSSALVRELLWRRRSVVWCSGKGRVIGWASSADSPNGHSRTRQGALSETGCLPIARRMVSAKIANQCTQLRRNGSAPQEVLAILRKLQRDVLVSEDLLRVFALEGQAASLYFSWFRTMLKQKATDFIASWPGREGRGATDPLNAALNYAYGLLLADCIRAIVASGLDPAAGFLHSSSRNKPALALDLMEEFRSPIAESVVVRAINNGELKAQMFYQRLGDSRLTDVGRKALIAAYEKRITTSIKHPTFGYSATWRRCIEIQARMLLGVIDGSQPDYRGLATR